MDRGFVEKWSEGQKDTLPAWPKAVKGLKYQGFTIVSQIMLDDP